jgi:hypothetical protein
MRPFAWYCGGDVRFTIVVMELMLSPHGIRREDYR